MTSSQHPDDEKPKTGGCKSRRRSRLEPQFVAVEVSGHNSEVRLEAFIRSLIYWAQEDGVIALPRATKRDKK